MLKYIRKYVKQNVAIKTASDLKHLFVMLAVYILSDLASNHPNFYIISFEEVYYKICLSEKSFFHFLRSGL